MDSRQAIEWFKKNIELNAYDPHGFIGLGRCLDWIGEHKESANAFKQAEALDANGWLTQAYLGWHYFQVEDYATARQWLEKSLSMMKDEKLNPVPYFYLAKIDEKQKKQGAAPQAPSNGEQ